MSFEHALTHHCASFDEVRTLIEKFKNLPVGNLVAVESGFEWTVSSFKGFDASQLAKFILKNELIPPTLGHFSNLPKDTVIEVLRDNHYFALPEMVEDQMLLTELISAEDFHVSSAVEGACAFSVFADRFLKALGKL